MRYAVRQVLDHEYHVETKRKQSDLIKNPSSLPDDDYYYVSKSGKSGTTSDNGQQSGGAKQKSHVKRDFFGRIIHEDEPQDCVAEGQKEDICNQRKVYVTFHEGYSNAVRKPISMDELLSGM